MSSSPPDNPAAPKRGRPRVTSPRVIVAARLLPDLADKVFHLAHVRRETASSTIERLINVALSSDAHVSSATRRR
jgi:hypothetical protein